MKRYRRLTWTETATAKRELKKHNYFLCHTFPFGIIEGVKG